uniref:BHLH domain-containing protein n=1 Tax=Chenopodium quinoa TaxID=63459 RepID=A0A803MNL6_CHEQI
MCILKSDNFDFFLQKFICSKFMEMSSGEWLSDLENEDPTSIMHHCQKMMSSDVFEFEDIFQAPDLILSNNIEPAVMEATNKITPSIDCSWSSSGKLICFGSSEFETKPKLSNGNNNKRVMLTSNEHVVAERRRREKMTQGFIALSALIPGLKKTDKASILGETVEYLKQLEDRAKVLEEQTSKRTMESVCLVNNIQTQTFDDAANSVSYSNKIMNPDDNLEIEAKVLNNNIFIRVHSLKNQGLIQYLLEEIGKLNLTTLNCQTMQFGSYAITITILAKECLKKK